MLRIFDERVKLITHSPLHRLSQVGGIVLGDPLGGRERVTVFLKLLHVTKLLHLLSSNLDDFLSLLLREFGVVLVGATTTWSRCIHSLVISHSVIDELLTF